MSSVVTDCGIVWRRFKICLNVSSDSWALSLHVLGWYQKPLFQNMNGFLLVKLSFRIIEFTSITKHWWLSAQQLTYFCAEYACSLDGRERKDNYFWANVYFSIGKETKLWGVHILVGKTLERVRMIKRELHKQFIWIINLSPI